MGLLDKFNINLTGMDGQIVSPARSAALEALLFKKLGDIDLVSVERLRSKKNVVLRLNYGSSFQEHYESIVAKLFITDFYETELRRLQISKEGGLRVPEVIAARGGVIVMTFVPGVPFVTRINESFDPVLVDQLASWYYEYHSINSMIKGDATLRNFICTSDGLYGLDFEESRKGHWMSDIGGTAASLLDTDPINDIRKRKLVWRLLDRYLTHLSESRNEATDRLYLKTIVDSLRETYRWRLDERILRLSEQIRTKGIPVR